MKHAKGPWEFDGYDTITSDGLTIAHLNAQEIENDPALSQQLGPLLAAAPDMLNTLHYVRQHLQLTISDIKDGVIDAVLFPRERALEKIEAAIAKAEEVTL